MTDKDITHSPAPSCHSSQVATISLRDVAVGYGSKVVLSGITADVYSGELTCIIGDNGIGKSTLLRTLAGFQKPISGHILLNGHDKSMLTRQQMAETVSVVLTERPDARLLTVEEMVGMGRTPYTGFWGTLTDADRRKVADAITATGISGMEKRMVGTLSDGELQKVMTAKALAQETPVIILDEPTAFLDFASKVETLRLLSRLARGEHKTVLLSSHDIETALQIADRLWILSASNGMVTGTPAQLAQSGDIARFLHHDGITFDKDSLEIRISR